jgi:hypothetical protein
VWSPMSNLIISGGRICQTEAMGVEAYGKKETTDSLSTAPKGNPDSPQGCRNVAAGRDTPPSSDPAVFSSLTNYLHCSLSPSIWWRLCLPGPSGCAPLPAAKALPHRPSCRSAPRRHHWRSASVPGITHASLLRFGHVWQRRRLRICPSSPLGALSLSALVLRLGEEVHMARVLEGE